MRGWRAWPRPQTRKRRRGEQRKARGQAGDSERQQPGKDVGFDKEGFADPEQGRTRDSQNRTTSRFPPRARRLIVARVQSATRETPRVRHAPTTRAALATSATTPATERTAPSTRSTARPRETRPTAAATADAEPNVEPRMMRVASQHASGPRVQCSSRAQRLGRDQRGAGTGLARVRRVQAHFLDAARVGIDDLELDAACVLDHFIARGDAPDDGEHEAAERVDLHLLVFGDELDAELVLDLGNGRACLSDEAEFRRRQ